MTIVLSGGTVIDPGSGRREIADVLITGDRVTAIGKDVERSGARIIDCAGRYVTPGLVEAHSHIFQHVSTVGAPAEEAHFRRGVVAGRGCGDGGSIHLRGIPPFRGGARTVPHPQLAQRECSRAPGHAVR